MTVLELVLIGVVVGVTTAMFGFGGGFVTVPVITVVDVAFGGDAIRVATATSALVMLVNAVVATAATRRDVLRRLSGRWLLFVLLAAGGAIGAIAGRFAPAAVLHWGFVSYVAITIVDLIARPGFFRASSKQGDELARQPGTRVFSSLLGLPIGVVAAFLGIGGSVMTVPMIRRTGESMRVATALSNPLTLTIAAPALVVSLVTAAGVPATAGLIGSVDVVSALALLVGSIPVVVVLRRRSVHIPDSVHSVIYIVLLLAVGVTVAVVG